MPRKYTLKRDPVELRRDKLAEIFDVHPKVSLPRSINLISKFPPAFDQGDLGSCTANAGCAVRSFLTGKTTILFSRLFQYFMERKMEGTISQDDGASMSDVPKAMAQYGVCIEKTWPYNISKFATEPTQVAEKEALTYKISKYHAINANVDTFRQYLALTQKPILIGMDVYESLEGAAVARNGMMPMPKPGEQLCGGHAVVIVGYTNNLMNSNQGTFIVRNSWGLNWGDKGYFYMPYDYIRAGHVYDPWVIEG